MEILLIRHGETAWNRERRMQGHIDIPLNDEGRRQARAVGLALAGEPPQAIVASDLQRARDTAQAIADVHQLPLQLSDALRERCYGAFEGMTYKEIGERYPEAMRQWKARDLHARFPAGERNAETLHEFHHRCVSAVTDIARRYDSGKLVIVAHGGVLDCLYRAATGMALDAERNFSIINAAINRLHWDGSRFSLLHWGDDTHLVATGLDEIDRSHPAA
jgi:probable phosphoglycerate mutase